MNKKKFLKIFAIRSVTTRLALVAAVAAIGCSVSFSVMAAGYVATILPTLGGTVTLPHGIDNSGAVTGESTTHGEYGGWHGFLWKNGVMTDLVESLNNTDFSWGAKSNPAGQVAGTIYGYSTAPFLYSQGVITKLEVSGYGNGYGNGINAAGDVVGNHFSNNTLLSGAFIYRGGVLTNLGTFGSVESSALAINNTGTVVGYTSNYANSTYRGFIWKNGAVTIIPPIARNSTVALDINDAGEVLGHTTFAADQQDSHVFIWKNGVMRDTGILVPLSSPPATQGYAINNAGHVLAPTGVFINNVFTPIANMLPPELAPGTRGNLTYMDHELRGMNDAGQVVGFFNILDRGVRPYAWKTVGFVLTPAASCN